MKNRKLPLFLFSILLSVALVYPTVKLWYVKTYGIYAIAKKNGISKGGKNGSSTIYEYRINNSKYYFSINDGGGGEEYIFTKFLTNRPSLQIVITTPNVPDCLRNDSLLGAIWNDLPICR